MADNTTISQTKQAWADIVIHRWEQAILKLGIGSSHALIQSLWHNLETEANGDKDMIYFTLLYYGKFVDMGVGKGVKAGQSSGTNRSPKPWYSARFFYEVKQLASLLAKKHALKGVAQIVEELEGTS